MGGWMDSPRPGLNPRGLWIFKGDKNPQRTFLRMGSKAVGLMSKDFMACKKSVRSMKNRYFEGQINFLC
jgi:hypothetical protein